MKLSDRIRSVMAIDPAAVEIDYRREPASGVDLGHRRSAAMVRAQALMLEDWRPALDGRDPARPIPTLRDGWRVQQLIDAARASSEGAGWVQVASDETGGHA